MIVISSFSDAHSSGVAMISGAEEPEPPPPEGAGDPVPAEPVPVPAPPDEEAGGVV